MTEFILFTPKWIQTERITSKLYEHKIYVSNQIKYLGILLDPKLSWNIHMAELNRGVGMLFRIGSICPEPVLKSLYYILFNSHLSYGITLFCVANSTLLETIFLLQKRAIRVITKSDFLTYTGPLFSNLKIMKLDDTYLLKLASLMWNYDQNLIPKSLYIWLATQHSHTTIIFTFIFLYI